MKMKYSQSRVLFMTARMCILLFSFTSYFMGPVYQGFTGRKMTAPQFQEQLVRSLNLRLSKEEVHAVMNYFDNNSDGYVDCV